jgi:type I restriction enzyme, S subunit
VTNWPTARLGDLCSITIGKTPSRARADFWGGGWPWLSIADMNQGRDLSRTAECITDVALKDSRHHLVAPGTVLMSFKLSIGKVGIARQPMYTNEAIAHFPVRDPNKLIPEYLCWALGALELASGADRAAMGSTLNLTKLKSIAIPLPSVEEQEHIVTILDRADALQSKRRKVCGQLDVLTRSIFDETLRAMRANQTATLDDIADLRRGPFGGALKKEIFVSEGYRVYEQGNAISGDFSLGRYFITEAKFNEMKSFALQVNDLIISCSGTLGRVALVPEDAAPGVINQALLRVRPHSAKVLPKFLLHALSTPTIQRKLSGMSHGTGLQNFPPMQEVRQLAVPVPDLAIQATVCRRIEAVERLRAVHKTSERQLASLFAALQQCAYKGEL